MANTSLRKASLESMEAEISSLLKSLESLKDDASDESRKTLKALKSNAENALKHSRHLISDAYEESKVKIRETGAATRLIEFSTISAPDRFAFRSPEFSSSLSFSGFGLSPFPIGLSSFSPELASSAVFRA